ncbi:MAG: dienelactone hydrolase family protein [Betaproteobacteria bacterium]|nr:MAG: dienelactone hydrolase family protein [Betaproteobacteria bacterium]
MDQRIIDLYDEFTHAPLERRVFIKRLVALAGSTSAAMALLPFLDANYAVATTIAADDARIEASHITYPGSSGPVRAYVARPRGTAKLPSVLIIHENRGLTPYIEDVARRAAIEGFVALAPDLLSHLGGTPADEDAGRQLFTKINREVAVADLVAGDAYLRQRADATGKIGCIGFCWGGGGANELAVHAPDLDAVVAFYGIQPALADVPKIKSKLLLHYAGNDTRVNAGIAAYEAALTTAGVRYTKYMYEGTQHAFHNEGAGARYNKDAAELAWRRSIDFLRAELKP